MSENYSAYTAIQAEGRRLGVVTCLRCGSAVLLDEDKGMEAHDAWHRLFDEWYGPTTQDAAK